MMFRPLLSLSLALALFSLPASATVLTGVWVGLPESWATYTLKPTHFGEGAPRGLSGLWSSAYANRSGWFYGSYSNFDGNVDVYDAGVVDPRTITHAENFNYTQSIIQVQAGETVFFRGTKTYGYDPVTQSYDHSGPDATGYYGAWTIDKFMAMERNPDGSFTYVAVPTDHNWIELIDAHWYFQSSGGGNFTPSAIPEPSGAATFALGLVVMRAIRPALRRARA